MERPGGATEGDLGNRYHVHGVGILMTPDISAESDAAWGRFVSEVGEEIPREVFELCKTAFAAGFTRGVSFAAISTLKAITLHAKEIKSE